MLQPDSDFHTVAYRLVCAETSRVRRFVDARFLAPDLIETLVAERGARAGRFSIRGQSLVSIRGQSLVCAVPPEVVPVGDIGHWFNTMDDW